MYHAIPTQLDCATAWREAVRVVDAQPTHNANNVVIDILNPLARSTMADPIVLAVDKFLRQQNEKPIETVANTIFPAALYRRFGAPEFFDRFRDDVLRKVRRSEKWSGYYFERMIQYPTTTGEPINQLWDIVERIRNPKVKALNKFELSIFDPLRDVNGSPYGGQCLSFASFKLIGKAGIRKLNLTVFYRNHFYIEKLLGNLIGLGRLMEFVANESGVGVGSLTVLSTHAQIDKPNSCTRKQILNLLENCDQANSELKAAIE